MTEATSPQKKTRSSGKKRRRSTKKTTSEQPSTDKPDTESTPVAVEFEAAEPATGTSATGDATNGEAAPPRKSRRRRRRKKAKTIQTDETASREEAAAPAAPSADGDGGDDVAPKRRKRSRRKKKTSGESVETSTADKPAARTSTNKPKPDAEERLMLINVAEHDECRIAIVHRNRLEEMFMERLNATSHVGNIYKGRVTNVEPSIQAAFIDFGLPKHGFLHISDLQPQYFPDNASGPEEVGRKTPRRDRPPIQKCLRRNQEVIVQITKEGIGTKGPTLTTYISLPGRYLVMMPGMDRLGVSRKIEDLDARRSMRDVLNELELPKGMGFILRTAGLDKSRRELQRDLNYLHRLWKAVARRIKNEPAPCELYQESDLVIRTIRDLYSSDFGRIIVDDEQTAQKVRDFLSIVAPRTTNPVEHFDGPVPLFHHYGIEAEIEKLHSRHVPLPLGGSLVIDPTEALVAIDVNSGKYRAAGDAEETAYRINLEAAEEIARQLRLRDLGGLIICDFIDMRMDKHCRGVERCLREALKEHKERAKILRMSQFGIIEITRQRTRPSINRSVYQDCPHCKGSGLVKTTESMSLDVARLLRVAATIDKINTIEIRVSHEVAFNLQNRYRGLLHEFERESGRTIVVSAQGNYAVDQADFICRDLRGGLVPFEAAKQSL